MATTEFRNSLSTGVGAGDLMRRRLVSETEFVNIPDRMNRLGWAAWRESIFELYASREVFWRLTRRDVVSRYRQSLIGVGWSIITPMALAGVFIFLNSTNLIHVGATDIAYPVFVLTGMIPWQLFASSLTRGSQSLVTSAHLVQRIRCSREVLVLSSLAVGMLDYLIGLALIGGSLAVYGVCPKWTVVFVPFVLVVQLVLCVGLALFLSVLNAALRDVGNGIALLMNIWLFLTPVLYPASETGTKRLLNWFNPMAPLIIAYRDLTFNGFLSEPWQFVTSCIVSFLSLVLGWRFFHSMMPHVAEKV